MSRLLHLATAAALAASSVGASAASLPALDLTSGSAAFSNTPIAGPFTDTAAFTLGSLTNLMGSVITVVGGAQNVDFTSIFITNTGTGATFSFSKANPDPYELWTTPIAGYTLPAGSYTMTLTGTNSPSIASYAGTVAITAVPELQTWAMVLAGLGIVGFVAGRRPN